MNLEIGRHYPHWDELSDVDGELRANYMLMRAELATRSAPLSRAEDRIAALEAERDRLKAALYKSEQTAERWRTNCMYFWSIS